MPAIKKSEQCIACGDNPRRVRKGKKFFLCEDCRRANVIVRLRIRKAKRTLGSQVGRLVQYNSGTDWRVGYLVKFSEHTAKIQPIGAIGRVPDIITVSLAEVKAEPFQSKSCPTVADFYRKNNVEPPKIAKEKDGDQPALAFKKSE